MTHRAKPTIICKNLADWVRFACDEVCSELTTVKTNRLIHNEPEPSAYVVINDDVVETQQPLFDPDPYTSNFKTSNQRRKRKRCEEDSPKSSTTSSSASVPITPNFVKRAKTEESTHHTESPRKPVRSIAIRQSIAVESAASSTKLSTKPTPSNNISNQEITSKPAKKAITLVKSIPLSHAISSTSITQPESASIQSGHRSNHTNENTSTSKPLTLTSTLVNDRNKQILVRPSKIVELSDDEEEQPSSSSIAKQANSRENEHIATLISNLNNIDKSIITRVDVVSLASEFGLLFIGYNYITYLKQLRITDSDIIMKIDNKQINELKEVMKFSRSEMYEFWICGNPASCGFYVKGSHPCFEKLKTPSQAIIPILITARSAHNIQRALGDKDTSIRFYSYFSDVPNIFKEILNSSNSSNVTSDHSRSVGYDWVKKANIKLTVTPTLRVTDPKTSIQSIGGRQPRRLRNGDLPPKSKSPAIIYSPPSTENQSTKNPSISYSPPVQTRTHVEHLDESDDDITMLEIPPPPPLSAEEAKKALLRVYNITITKGDLARLAPGEYLNDNIIDFWYHHITENNFAKHANRFHIFNSHLYPLLLKDCNRAALRVPSEKVKIFERDLIFLPICQDLHWIVAVICFLPRLKRKLDAIIRSKTDISFEEEEPEAEEEKPFIMVCDSLEVSSNEDSSTNRRDLLKLIRTYLTLRFQEELKEQLLTLSKVEKAQFASFTHSEIPQRTPTLPQQNNTCDCGVYILEYTERMLSDFFKYYKNDSGFSTSPDNFNLPVKKSKWFDASVIEAKRTTIQSVIEQKAKEEKDLQAALDESLLTMSITSSVEQLSQDPFAV